MRQKWQRSLLEPSDQRVQFEFFHGQFPTRITRIICVNAKMMQHNTCHNNAFQVIHFHVFLYNISHLLLPQAFCYNCLISVQVIISFFFITSITIKCFNQPGEPWRCKITHIYESNFPIVSQYDGFVWKSLTCRYLWEFCMSQKASCVLPGAPIARSKTVCYSLQKPQQKLNIGV